MNLTIKPNCITRKILFDGNTATGVEVISGKEIFQVDGKEIILSAGAIATPQILMLSGIGPKESLTEFDIDMVTALPLSLIHI